MSDPYESKAPFRADGLAVEDVTESVCALTVSSEAFAARIAAALNAEERVKELEAFMALVASMTLEGEEDDYRSGPFKPDHADQHETLEYLIRQARNLAGGTDADTAD